MIIWLASYPKSGNTWIRSFIYSLIYSKNNKADLENLYRINQYPLKSHFNNKVKDYSNINEVSKFWIESQKLINSNGNIRFIKTHHIMCNLNGNSFTDLKNTLGVIHIVRDPRNVISSILHHYSKENYEQALEFILDESRSIDVENLSHKNLRKEDILYTLISSWKNHYNSWKNFPKNYILLKYEDLVENTNKSFLKLCNYLSKILKIKITEEQIYKSIEENSFKNLQKIEKKINFKESIDKKKFFHLGPENKWENIIRKDIKEKIEKNFYREMKELEYII